MILPSFTNSGCVDLASIKYCRKSGFSGLKLSSSPFRRAVMFSTAIRVTLEMLGGPSGYTGFLSRM